MAVPAARGSPKIPVLETAPSQAVLLSEDLLDYEYNAPALIRAIRAAGAEAWIATNAPKADDKALRSRLAKEGLSTAELLGVRAVALPHGNIWLRDFGPLFAREGSQLAAVDLRFEDPATKASDAFPLATAKHLGWTVTSVPLSVDGGNLLATRDYCFTSGDDLSLRGSVRTGGAAPTAETLKAFQQATGCAKLIEIEDPPHAHVDMWMKVVGEDTVLVNELDDETMAAARKHYGSVPADIVALKKNLDEKARMLAKLVKVERLPMPLPYRGAFRTYANAALVNDVAITPSYERFGWNYDDYPDAAQKARYERLATAAYAKHGFAARFVRADGLTHNGGAFHCILLQIPRKDR